METEQDKRRDAAARVIERHELCWANDSKQARIRAALIARALDERGVLQLPPEPPV
jgi:hypothetical protein